MHRNKKPGWVVLTDVPFGFCLGCAGISAYKSKRLHFFAHIGLLRNLRSRSLGRSGLRRCGLLRGGSLLGCGLFSLALDDGSLLDGVGSLAADLRERRVFGFASEAAAGAIPSV